jgi:hypothetical protein
MSLASERWEEKEEFFFEKKEPKNVYSFAPAAGEARANEQKFFASFFQKRRYFLSYACTSCQKPASRP